MSRHTYVGILGIVFVLTFALASSALAAAEAVEPNIPEGFKFGTYTQKPWDGTTIRVAMVAEPRSDALAELADEFTELTGINVEFNILAYPTLQEKQMVALTQGTGAYDIVHVDCVWVGQYAGEGWTVPLEKFIEHTDPDTLALDDFIPAVLEEQGMWEGKIYGPPFIQAVFGLHYRTDIFDKYNMTVPQTWEQLRETAEALNLKEPDVHGITFMGRRGVQLQCTYDNILWSYGGEWYDEDYNPTINSPEAVAALEYFKTLIPFAPEGVLTYDWDENANAFAQGRAAMTIQWQNAAPRFYDPEQSKIVGNFEFTLIPGKEQPDGSIKRTPTFGGWSLQIPKDAPNKEAAWEFLVWASSRELDPRLAYSQPGSRISGLQDPAMQEKYIEYAGMLESLPLAKGRPRIAPYAELADALEVALSEAMTGEKSAQDALDEANTKFEFILRQWGYLE
ncbi:extracellular solute-binding protein [candidate division KSB3 bacterium]|uniref:Extracellular solute-binding protein n=1 Tax=candidate division KSB3 bacterium TaxID=2044937 RepID=A0A9D5Q8L0_9BACT|nr:extracellular solute-binding protein [candidate division KSB3 bacterium]MBD3327583.1 extracellular solute-binding protein [candidate division KSB3 bacterium]